MSSKYKAVWNVNEVNKDFWNEVLVGRMIVKVNYDDVGVVSFVLDSGEVVIPTDTIAVQDDD